MPVNANLLFPFAGKRPNFSERTMLRLFSQQFPPDQEREPVTIPRFTTSNPTLLRALIRKLEDRADALTSHPVAPSIIAPGRLRNSATPGSTSTSLLMNPSMKRIMDAVYEAGQQFPCWLQNDFNTQMIYFQTREPVALFNLQLKPFVIGWRLARLFNTDLAFQVSFSNPDFFGVVDPESHAAGRPELIHPHFHASNRSLCWGETADTIHRLQERPESFVAALELWERWCNTFRPESPYTHIYWWKVPNPPSQYPQGAREVYEPDERYPITPSLNGQFLFPLPSGAPIIDRTVVANQIVQQWLANSGGDSLRLSFDYTPNRFARDSMAGPVNSMYDTVSALPVINPASSPVPFHLPSPAYLTRIGIEV